MAELETVLTPLRFNGGEPCRFVGVVQMLSDPTPLLGRAIAYQRLIASPSAVSDGSLGIEPSHDDGRQFPNSLMALRLFDDAEPG